MALTKAVEWRWFRKLIKPFVNQTKKRQGMLSSTTKTQKFTHVCILCVKSLPERDREKHMVSACCTVSNTSNARCHLFRKHADVPEVASFKKKVDSDKRDVVLQHNAFFQSPRIASTPSNQRTFHVQSNIFHRNNIARWLIHGNRPYETVQDPYFKIMMSSCIRDYKSMSRSTFNDFVSTEFDIFIKHVAKMICTEYDKAFQMSFLTILHDMWTNEAGDNMLGASI